MAGQWWRRRKPRRDAGWTALRVLVEAFGNVWKKDFIEFCRNGVMPLMFHEKMRIALGSGSPGTSDGGACGVVKNVAGLTFLRFAGGGLISRSISG